MSEFGILFLLYGVGVLMLVAELFIPSHGVLTVVGLGFLIAGISMTFQYHGQQAGALAILACLVGLPIFGVVAVKVWPKTWIGKRIAPPNPVHDMADTSVPFEEMSQYVGQTGRAVSALRPVGVCEFEGRRISCVADYGTIDAGTTVEGLRVNGGTLAVGPTKSQPA